MDIPAFALCIVVAVVSLIVLAMHSLTVAALVVLGLVAGVAIWSVLPDAGNDDWDCHP